MPMSPFLLVPRKKKAGSHPPAPQLDADAAAYIAKVEAADGSLLESAVKSAISDFVAGLKADNAWSKIDHMCLLAGPKTAAGAKVALKGSDCSFDASHATHDRAFGFRSIHRQGFYVDSGVQLSTLAKDDAWILAYFGEWQHSDAYVFGSSAVADGGCCLLIEGGLSDDPSFNQSHAVHACFRGQPVNSWTRASLGRSTCWFSRNSSTAFYTYTMGQSTAHQSPSTGTAALAGSIHIGGTAGYPGTLNVEAYIPVYAIGKGGITLAISTRIDAYRLALQSAIPPASLPSVPVWKWSPFYFPDGGAPYFWIEGDQPAAAEYRVYADGVRVPAASVVWDPNQAGLCSIRGQGTMVGKSFELAAWNGKGEARTAPIVIASGNPPS